MGSVQPHFFTTSNSYREYCCHWNFDLFFWQQGTNWTRNVFIVWVPKKHLWSTFNSFLCKVMDCVEWEVVDVSDVYNRWKDLCVWHKIGDVAWIIAFIWYSIVCTFDVFSFLRVKTFDSLNVDDHQRIFKCMNSVFARLFSLTFDLRYH